MMQRIMIVCLERTAAGIIQQILSPHTQYTVVSETIPNLV